MSKTCDTIRENKYKLMNVVREGEREREKERKKERESERGHV